MDEANGGNQSSTVSPQSRPSSLGVFHQNSSSMDSLQWSTSQLCFNHPNSYQQTPSSPSTSESESIEFQEQLYGHNEFLSKSPEYFLNPLLFRSPHDQAVLRTLTYPIHATYNSYHQRHKFSAHANDMPVMKKRNRQHSIDSSHWFDSSRRSFSNRHSGHSVYSTSPQETSQPYIFMKVLFFVSIVPMLAILMVFSLSYLSFQGEKIKILKQILEEWNALESSKS